MDDLSIISKDQKQATAKALMDLNYSATEVAGILGIDRTTVYRYAEKPMSADVLQFATEIKTLFSLKQTQLMARILKRIEDMVESTNDIRALVVAYKVLHERSQNLYQIKKEEHHQKRFGGLGLD